MTGQSHTTHTHNMPKACTREPSRARAHRQPQPTLHVWIACNVFLSLRWGYAREMRAGGPLPFFFLAAGFLFLYLSQNLLKRAIFNDKKKVMGRSDKHKPSFWKSSGAECMKRAHNKIRRHLSLCWRARMSEDITLVWQHFSVALWSPGLRSEARIVIALPQASCPGC